MPAHDVRLYFQGERMRARSGRWGRTSLLVAGLLLCGPAPAQNAEPPAASVSAQPGPGPDIPVGPSGDIANRNARGRTVALPANLSPWGMFLGADIVVKAVMVGLAFASVVTWTVWLAKSLELLGALRSGGALLARVTQARSLGEAVDAVQGSSSIVAALTDAAAAEAEISFALGSEGLKERAASRLERIEAAAARRMSQGTGLLATIGSTAPFVGLFGTVWGIMNAFIGISKTQTTSLAVVAPGIAEALLATAIGLVAAIPAVIIYNLFARWIAGYRALLADATAEILRHLSRDLDRMQRLRAAE